MRTCSKTGNKMSSGWFFEGSDLYASTEEIAFEFCRELGYSSIDEAYEDRRCYYTEWNESDVDLDDE